MFDRPTICILLALLPSLFAIRNNGTTTVAHSGPHLRSPAEHGKNLHFSDERRDLRGEDALLIVTPKKFVSALQPLKSHKDKTGIATQIDTLESIENDYSGHDIAEKVKQRIVSFDRFNRQGKRFVLLVGDSDTFPVRYTQTDRRMAAAMDRAYYPTDLYYSALYKNDGITFDDWDVNNNGFFGELHGETITGRINFDQVNLDPVVAVGRIPASTVEGVERYVAKVIRYEVNAYNAEWPEKALLTATHDWKANACSLQHATGAALSLSGYETYFLFSKGSACNPRTGDLTPTAMNGQLNSGVGLVSYIGHGHTTALAMPDGWWGVNNVGQLSNQEMLPVMAVSACDTARFATLPPYHSYVDVFGQTHAGTEAGEVFRSIPPQPACVQPAGNTDPDYDLATRLTVGSDVGVIAYLGGVTGMQYSEPTQYFMNAIRSSETVGEAVQDMVKYYYSSGIGTGMEDASLSTPDWTQVAKFHQPWKTMLFGDPSLRISGVPKPPDTSCTSEENQCSRRVLGGYSMKKTTSGDCVDRCVLAFMIRIRKLFGWECGVCGG